MATAKIAHANINVNGEAAGLVLINSLNPNHFLKTTLQFKNDTDPDQSGDQPGKWAERVLTAGGNPITLPPATVPWPNSGALTLSGDYVWVRFVHDSSTGQLTTWTSTNGTTFASFGAPIPVAQYLNQPGGFRIGLFAKHDGSGNDTVQFDAFNVVPAPRTRRRRATTAVAARRVTPRRRRPRTRSIRPRRTARAAGTSRRSR